MAEAQKEGADALTAADGLQYIYESMNLSLPEKDINVLP